MGLSATPWIKGLGLIYDELIAPITMRGLIEQGRLLNFRVFAPAHPDLSGVSVTGGDYNGKQLGDKMNDNALVADIVTTWAKLGEGRPTLCYCVDRAHAQKVCDRFLSAGIPAEYIDMNTESPDRRKIQERLESGQTKVVCNIATLTKGIDWKIGRSEEHTHELQSLMRISYAVFCLKKKKQTINKIQIQANIKSNYKTQKQNT